MCSEEKLVSILDDLVDEEFTTFKWHLKKETWNGMEPIKPNKLQKAERIDVVDLMVQKYELSGAASVMGIIFSKISRNDLVNEIKLQTGEAEGPKNPKEKGGPSNSENWTGKLASVQADFVIKVSSATLEQLQDHLLGKGILTDGEMEFGNITNAAKARQVISMVRKKGQKASGAMISALCELDPCLAEELKLK